MHDDMFCEYVDVMIVGIVDIYHHQLQEERSIRQSRDDFPCQACLAICLRYLFHPHPLGPHSISRHRRVLRFDIFADHAMQRVNLIATLVT